MTLFSVNGKHANVKNTRSNVPQRSDFELHCANRHHEFTLLDQFINKHPDYATAINTVKQVLLQATFNTDVTTVARVLHIRRRSIPFVGQRLIVEFALHGANNQTCWTASNTFKDAEGNIHQLPGIAYHRVHMIANFDMDKIASANYRHDMVKYIVAEFLRKQDASRRQQKKASQTQTLRLIELDDDSDTIRRSKQ